MKSAYFTRKQRIVIPHDNGLGRQPLPEMKSQNWSFGEDSLVHAGGRDSAGGVPALRSLPLLAFKLNHAVHSTASITLIQPG